MIRLSTRQAGRLIRLGQFSIRLFSWLFLLSAIALVTLSIMILHVIDFDDVNSSMFAAMSAISGCALWFLAYVTRRQVYMRQRTSIHDSWISRLMRGAGSALTSILFLQRTQTAPRKTPEN
jgi:hypothetical protein